MSVFTTTTEGERCLNRAAAAFDEAQRAMDAANEWMEQAKWEASQAGTYDDDVINTVLEEARCNNFGTASRLIGNLDIVTKNDDEEEEGE